MARGINKVILIGNVGADPELRYTPSGAAVTNFNVATNESWTDKSGERQDQTEWHRIVAWSRLAEICNQYLRKGSKVYVEGRLQTRSWDDQAGQKRYSTEIVVNDMQMLDSRAGGGGDYAQPQGQYGGAPQDSYGQQAQQGNYGGNPQPQQRPPQSGQPQQRPPQGGAPHRPLPEGCEFHFFLSHYQASGGDQVNTLCLELERLGVRCWYDNQMEDLTKEAKVPSLDESPIMREIEALIRHRHGQMIPDPTGTDDVDACMAYVTAAAGSQSDQDMRDWCAYWAPWISPSDLDAIVIRSSTRKRMIPADDVARLLGVTFELRSLLTFKTIGACDVSKAERQRLLWL